MTETDRQLDRRLEQAIIALLERRAATSSICPSDAAREVHDGDDEMDLPMSTAETINRARRHYLDRAS